MIDLRPVGYITGLTVAVLGVSMLLPMWADLVAGNSNWTVFLTSAIVTTLIGGLVAVACANASGQAMRTQHAFLLTTVVWVAMPLFGAMPFMLGQPGSSFTDAYFEAMSGITTTGTTVFVGLDDMAPGVLLWRSILQWLGGLGIVIVALIFFPVMRVGGMQYFRSESFDTMGKVLPRALDISRALVEVYVLITVLCVAAYLSVGMSAFDALNHGLTTIATGGYSTSDLSFVAFPPAAEYVAVLFMILAGFPFVRYVQLMGGSVRPLFQDLQARAYVRWVGYAVGAVLLHRLFREDVPLEQAVRETAFNVISIFSGTGYGSADVLGWGDFPLVILIVVGMIGACTASTGCSIKIFRYLVLLEAIRAQIRLILSPNRVVLLHLGGRPLGMDVVNSVIALFSLFLLTFGVIAVALALTGLETQTAVTASWTSVFNIGPAFGPEIGPTGAVDGFPETAKWVMIAAMLLGRLELISVLVLLLPRFWRG